MSIRAPERGEHATVWPNSPAIVHQVGLDPDDVVRVDVDLRQRATAGQHPHLLVGAAQDWRSTWPSA